MKKYLLPKGGDFYRANLHCHSTFSDGKKTPQEIKDIYKAMGYSVVAYTDHDIFIPHDELSDDSFLALHGFEVEINEPGSEPWMSRKCCHICYIALDKDNLVQPMWNEEYLFRNALKYKDLVKKDETQPPYIRKYTGEKISEMMQVGRESGFFVTYNHPNWSMETYAQYIEYDGMHAFEMFNGGCMTEGYDDYNPHVYDEILASGKMIYCIGADDNHNAHEEGTHRWDSGVAFTDIKAPNLEYSSITSALLSGSFYCSDGPTVSELWVEDGRVHIECSEAESIICTYGVRKKGVAYAEGGKMLTCADFEANPEYGYFRITVTDKYGKHACTNAYRI